MKWLLATFCITALVLVGCSCDRIPDGNESERVVASKSNPVLVDRTATTDTYDLGDGKKKVTYYSDVVNIQDETGKYVPFEDYINITIDKGLKFYRGDRFSVTFQPIFVMKNGKKYYWDDIPSGVEKNPWSEKYRGGVKYGYDFNYIPPKIAQGLQYVVLNLSGSTGLTYDDVKLENSSIIVKNRVRFSHDDILRTYTIPQITGQRIVIGNISENLVPNADNTYNISFDPTVNYDEDSSIHDYYCTSDDSTCTNGNTLRIYGIAPSFYIYETFIYFYMPEIEGKKYTIDNATLNLTIDGADPPTYNVIVSKPTQVWTERDSSRPSTEPIGITYQPSTNANDVDKIVITDLVQNWSDGIDENYGISFDGEEPPNPMDDRETEYESSESANGNERPTLTVWYSYPSITNDIVYPINKVSVSENDNLSIRFWVKGDGTNITSDVDVSNVSIGTTQATIKTNPTIIKDNFYYTGFERGLAGWVLGDYVELQSYGGGICDDDSCNVNSPEGDTQVKLADDNEDYSEMYRTYDFRGYDYVNFSFWYRPHSFESGEYITLSCDDTEIWRFTDGDGAEGSYHNLSLNITPSDCTFDSMVNLTFSGYPGLSGTADYVYFDGINVTGVILEKNQVWYNDTYWIVNVTVPAGTGDEEVVLNISYMNNLYNNTEADAVSYGGGADSCDCPGDGNNWVFDKHCVVDEDCDIASGRVSFTGNFQINCSANINCSYIDDNSTTSSIVNKGACSITYS